LFFLICEEFVKNLTYLIYISLISAIYKNNLKFGIYLSEICNYPQITSLYPMIYTKEIIVNIEIRWCKYSYKTM
jgi:hypothetical protein